MFLLLVLAREFLVLIKNYAYPFVFFVYFFTLTYQISRFREKMHDYFRTACAKKLYYGELYVYTLNA